MGVTFSFAWEVLLVLVQTTLLLTKKYIMVNQFVKFGVMAACMILSRFVDTTNPDTLLKVRIGYVITIVMTAFMNWYIRNIVRAKNDRTKIYIVNKMLGQEIVEETTYLEYEEKQCTSAITGSVSGVLMTMGLMSYKMGMHYGMIMQIMQLPLNIYSNVLFQKHILNKKLDHPWKEQTEVPLSKMDATSTVDALKAEITKCWDDGEIAVYDHLLELCKMAPVNTTNENGWTPLMIVMGNPLGDSSVVTKLIKAGADMSLKDKEGWNCIHWAAYHNNVGAVEALIEVVGCRYMMEMIVEKDLNGLTPIEVAKKEGKVDFVAWMRTTVLDEIDMMNDLQQDIKVSTKTLLMPLLEDKE